MDALLYPKGRKRPQSEKDFPSASPPATLLDSSNKNPKMNVEAQTQSDVLREVFVGQPSATVGLREPQLADLENSHSISVPKNGQVLRSGIRSLNSEQSHPLATTVADQLEPQERSYAWDFGTLSFPIDYSFSMSPSIQTVTVTSPTIFAEKILQACKKYMGLNPSEYNEDVIMYHDIASYGWAKEAQDMSNVGQISTIGVYMLAAFAGLEPYLYGVVSMSLVLLSLTNSLG